VSLAPAPALLGPDVAVADTLWAQTSVKIKTAAEKTANPRNLNPPFAKRYFACGIYYKIMYNALLSALISQSYNTLKWAICKEIARESYPKEYDVFKKAHILAKIDFYF
jgi:hypothetical protein